MQQARLIVLLPSDLSKYFMSIHDRLMKIWTMSILGVLGEDPKVGAGHGFDPHLRLKKKPAMFLFFYVLFALTI